MDKYFLQQTTYRDTFNETINNASIILQGLENMEKMKYVKKETERLKILVEAQKESLGKKLATKQKAYDDKLYEIEDLADSIRAAEIDDWDKNMVEFDEKESQLKSELQKIESRQYMLKEKGNRELQEYHEHIFVEITENDEEYKDFCTAKGQYEHELKLKKTEFTNEQKKIQNKAKEDEEELMKKIDKEYKYYLKLVKRLENAAENRSENSKEDIDASNDELEQPSTKVQKISELSDVHTPIEIQTKVRSVKSSNKTTTTKSSAIRDSYTSFIKKANMLDDILPPIVVSPKKEEETHSETSTATKRRPLATIMKPILDDDDGEL